MGSGTACCGGRQLVFFFFSNCQRYFYHRKASRPLSQASARRGGGWSPVWFLSEGLGESALGKQRFLGFPCPASPKPHPILLPPWRDGNKKHLSRRRSQEAQLSLEKKKHKALVMIEGGWSGRPRPLGSQYLMPRPQGLPLSPAPILREACDGERPPSPRPRLPRSQWSERRALVKNVQEPCESGATRATLSMGS